MINQTLKLLMPYLIPKAVAWVKQGQRNCRACGRSLAPAETELAELAGIQRPHEVFVLRVHSIPLPDSWALRTAGSITGLFSQELTALTVGYGIYIKSGSITNDLLAHEFTHIAQHEKAGGIHGFLIQYLQEMVEYGYVDAPMEIEARLNAERIG
jgi:hypothetical protein